MLKVRRIDFSFVDSIDGSPSAVIYFQGCHFKCFNCHNPELQDFNVAVEQFTPNELIQQLEINKDFYNTVVLLGGEPLQQNINDIEKLLKLLHDKGFKVVLYTGYNFEDIQHYSFLKYVNILKCGRYIEKLKTNNFPASTNQKVYINDGGVFVDVTNTFYSK